MSLVVFSPHLSSALRLSLCTAAIAVAGACGSSGEAPVAKSPDPAAPAAPEPQELFTCREAVHEEARLLVAKLGERDAPQGLAIQLDEIAASFEVTWETLESLGQLRTTSHGLIGEDRKVVDAAALVERVCAGLDDPLARARRALDHAIGLLEREKYAEFIETITPPAELAPMKASGDYNSSLRRLRSGFGRTLRQQLLRARKVEPVLLADGSVEFRPDGKGGKLVVLVPIGGRWFFRQ